MEPYNNNEKEDQPNSKKRKLINIQIPIIFKYKDRDLILNGDKSYSVKGFNGLEVDKEIRLESMTISPNELPEERFIFRNGVINLITSTQTCYKIEGKFAEIFEWQKHLNYYIRGPSGTGKTFALLYGTLLLKNHPGMKEYCRVVHVILSNSYLEYFIQCFLKDLMFCFSIDRFNPLFPRPPNFESIGCPIKGWLEYILEVQEKWKKIRNIKELMIGLKQFCSEQKKKIWLIIDEENAFQRSSKPFLQEYQDFIDCLMSDNFCDVIINGFSERDDMIAVPKILSQESMVYLNNFFQQDDMEKFLKFYYPKIIEIEQNDSTLFQDILYFVQVTTGRNPLELIIFVQYNESMDALIGDNYKSMCKNYMEKRSADIKYDHNIFYKTNLSNNPERLGTFLSYFLQILSGEEINNKSFEFFVDRKYIYLDEKNHLEFTCPIAKRVFKQLYYYKITKIENETSKFCKSIPEILSQSKINQSGKRTLFEFYIVSIIKTSKKKFDFLYHSIFKKRNDQTYFWKKQKLSLDYKFCDEIFLGDFDNIKELKDNCLLIPVINNVFSIDFIYWENNTKIFYVFQCTVNVISQQRSDILFINSQFYKRLSETHNDFHFKFIWICGSHEITTDTIEKEYEKTNPFDENSGFLFPKENTHIFGNLSI